MNPRWTINQSSDDECLQEIDGDKERKPWENRGKGLTVVATSFGNLKPLGKGQSKGVV